MDNYLALELRSYEMIATNPDEEQAHFYNLSPQLMCIIGIDGHFCNLNQAGEEILGFTQAEIINKSYLEFVHPEDLAVTIAKADQLTNGIVKTTKIENRYRAKDGLYRWLLWNATYFKDQQKIYCIAHDITRHKQAELDLQQSLKQSSDIRFALDQAAIIAITDQHGIITYVNDKFCQLSQFTRQELIGDTHRLINSKHHDRQFFKQLWSTISQGQVWKGEIKNKTKDGTYYWLDATIVPFLDNNGKPYQYLAIRFEITQKKQAEQKLHYEAFYDNLTQLPNRVNFMKELQTAWEQTKINPNSIFAVLCLDLDRFKMINDSLNHSIGDRLLQAFGQRLKTCVRPTDIVARLGGDEFAILVKDIPKNSQVNAIAHRIHNCCHKPFFLDNHTIYTSTCIGIALSSNNYTQIEHILRDADIALYRAKEKGRSHYAIFDQKMHDRAIARMDLETKLRQALEQQEFELHYQPIVNLKTGKIDAFEALIRWNQKDKRKTSPSEFIPIAEDTGLIIPLGQWVLTQACHQLSKWTKKHPNLCMSVNLSVKQFAQPDFINQLDHIINQTQINPQNLKLELTESVIMENPDEANILLSQIKQRHIKLSIDDFGTGYSSLNYLHRFPLDTLKIDQSFIKQLEKPTSQIEIVQAITMLAHNLGLDVVAEGIETQQQLQFLKTLNCEYGQGYLFSRPTDAKTIDNLLNTKPKW